MAFKGLSGRGTRTRYRLGSTSTGSPKAARATRLSKSSTNCAVSIGHLFNVSTSHV